MHEAYRRAVTAKNFTENGVGTRTVQADARGLAEVHFTADSDTTGDVTVIAGSPLTAGNQRFLVRVNDRTASR
jgi:hypothetical protein